MNIARKEYIARNFIWGCFSTLINISLPFLSRTLIIYTIGVEFLGIGSLFSSILEALNLAELGLSSAIIYNMYSPMARHDVDTVCSLLKFYRNAYRCIGVIILLLGIAISPFLSNIISGGITVDIDLWSLYFIFLCNSVVSYFFYGYKTCLIITSQRNDVLEKINILLNATFFLIQAVVLYLSYNYYAFVFVLIIKNITNNFYVHFVTRKKFPEFECRGEICDDMFKGIKKNIFGLIIGKLCLISRNSFDNIFISFYLGINYVAIYGNYYSVFQVARKIMSVFLNSISASIGNSVAVDDIVKNYNDLKKLTFVYSFLSAWVSIGMICMCQPFMRLWVGPELMFPTIDVLLIVLYFYIGTMGDVRSQYQTAKGLFWESRFYVASEACLNLFLNAVMGYYLGIHGIILATLISLFLCNFLWGASVVFKKYFIGCSLREYLILQLRYFVVFVFAMAISVELSSMVTSMMPAYFFIDIIIAILFPPFFYWIIFRHTSMYCDVINIVNGMARKMLHK